MANKYINNGSYAASGYTLSGAFSGVTIGTAGTIGGSGLVGGYTGSYTIVNHGHITGTYVGIALTQVSTVINTG